MSEPTQGPYEVRLGSNPMAESFGLPCIVPAGRVVALAVLPDRVIEQYDGFGDLMADAHLLASSWAMREALQAVHDWRGLCDSGDLETFERIGAMFQRDTGFLRPGKDDVRHDQVQRQGAWNVWTKKKNDEIDALIRAALAASRGEAKS